MKDYERVRDWVRKNSEHVKVIRLGKESRKDGPIKVIRL